MKDRINSVIHEMLKKLEANRLPPWLIERLANEFSAKANENLRKLAAREITHKKLARLFAAGEQKEAGCRGETLVSPPAEQGTANEVRQGL